MPRAVPRFLRQFQTGFELVVAVDLICCIDFPPIAVSTVVGVLRVVAACIEVHARAGHPLDILRRQQISHLNDVGIVEMRYLHRVKRLVAERMRED